MRVSTSDFWHMLSTPWKHYTIVSYQLFFFRNVVLVGWRCSLLLGSGLVYHARGPGFSPQNRKENSSDPEINKSTRRCLHKENSVSFAAPLLPLRPSVQGSPK